MRLQELEIGIAARIKSIHLSEKEKKHLFYIGLYEGVIITKIQVAPLHDPALYFVLGNQIMLRNKDADHIEVEVII